MRIFQTVLPIILIVGLLFGADVFLDGKASMMEINRICVASDAHLALFLAAQGQKEIWLVESADHGRSCEVKPEECKQRVLSFLESIQLNK